MTAVRLPAATGNLSGRIQPLVSGDVRDKELWFIVLFQNGKMTLGFGSAPAGKSAFAGCERNPAIGGLVGTHLAYLAGEGA
jgi:hypothetical protein